MSMSAVVTAQAAWLVLVVTDRDRRGNDRYDDEPASHYSWDSTVPNRDAVQVGDALVLWDSHTLLGASVIEYIACGTAQKNIVRCQGCGGGDFERRKTLTPTFRCPRCKAEFDEPVTATKDVRTYRTDHEAGWVDLHGALSGDQLRQLCLKPRSQLSIRALDWTRFTEALRSAHPELPLTAVTTTAGRIRHGHKDATVRVRVGQSEFRRRLVERYGNVCAFSGLSPIAALEAAHLYSYAAEGKHHDDGGFLIRRDLHRLFDLGLIAFDSVTGRLSLAQELRRYPLYEPLHNRKVSIELSEQQRSFLRQHWDQHRGGLPR